MILVVRDLLLTLTPSRLLPGSSGCQYQEYYQDISHHGELDHEGMKAQGTTIEDIGSVCSI